MATIFRFCSLIGCIKIVTALLVAGLMPMATNAAGYAIIEPEKAYYFLGWGVSLTDKTKEELIEQINAHQSSDFESCISGVRYNCKKRVVSHAEESQYAPVVNGETTSFILVISHIVSQSKSAEGVVTTAILPSHGNVAGDVRWKCPESYHMRNDKISPGVYKYTCVILAAPAKNKGPSDGSCPTPYGGNPINFSVGNKYQEEVDFQVAGFTFSRAYNSLDGHWRHGFSMRLEFDLLWNTVYLTRETGKLSIFSLNNGVVTSEAIELGKLVNNGDYWVYTSPSNDQFIFNGDGLLIQQKYLGGVERNLVYDQGQVTVTDNFGNSLIFVQDEAGQPLSFQIGTTQGAYSYNAEKQLVAVDITTGGAGRTRLYHYEDSRDAKLLTGITDERGVRFATWTYDDKGRAISSEHAGGVEKIQISYDSSTSTSVTNEFGKITKYTFRDFSGLKRIASIVGEPSANCPNSNSSYGYNSRGQLTSKTDNKGYRTTYVYDTRGLESSRTEAFGTPQARTITTEWHPTMFLPLVVTEPKRIIRYQYDNQGRQLSRTVEAR